MESKELIFEALPDDEKKFILALRDPVKGPKIREIIQSDERE